MKFTKSNIKYILLIITFTVVLSAALFNFSVVNSVFKKIFNVFFPILLGFFFAFILNLPMRNIEKLFSKSKNKVILKIKRPVSLVLSIICIFAVLIGLIIVVIPNFVKAIGVLIDYIPKAFNSSVEWFKNSNYPIDQIEKYIKTIEINWEEIGKQTLKMLSSGASGALAATFSFIVAVFDGIVNVTIGFMISLYLLLSKEKFVRQFKMVNRAVFSEKWYKKIMKVFNLANKTFAKYFVGQVADASILGLMCLVGMLLLRIPYASLVSAMIGVLALIPIVGLFIAVILGTFMILMVSPVKALIFLLFYFVLQQIEGNFVYPKVIGSSVGIAPVWVLIAVIIGGGLFGIPGLIFAVPIMSVIYTLVKDKTNERLKIKEVAKKNSLN